MSDITLDLTRGAPREPLNIPILIGATGERMARLAGEIADGVVFNGFLPPSYTRATSAAIREAAAAAGRDPSALELPQLIAVAMSEDGDEARAVAHRFATMYLGGQPHIAQVVGLDPELTGRLGELVGGWPPRPGGVEPAMALLDPAVSASLVVAGTAAECRSRLDEWVEAGASYPIVTPLTENPEEICEALAPGAG